MALELTNSKRRPSQHQEEQSGFRGASSNRPSSHTLSRPRPNSSSNDDRHATTGPPPLPSIRNLSTSQSAEQTLAQRLSPTASRNRRSRDVTLPQWQPDGEVTECPICGINFSFWYRKHHCRKCGRVVCANCSPHRITIPRQFIVQPPEDAPPSPVTVDSSGVEIVDLTADSETESGDEISNDRPQSSDYRIDPALGGGQEVRLCNPCVPDPNPLPHLPPNLRGQHSFNAFPRPERLSSLHGRESTTGVAVSGDRNLGYNERANTGHPEQRRPSLSGRDQGSTSGFTPSSPSSSSGRRYSHAQRPQGSSMGPPGYSAIYGSAPDRTAHQVSFFFSLSKPTPHRLTNQSVNLLLSFKSAQLTVTTVIMCRWAPCQIRLHIVLCLGQTP